MHIRRYVLFFSLPVLLVLSGCKYFCGKNCHDDSAAPVVCIDPKLNANPDPVHVRRTQWVHFFLPPGAGELNIEADFLEDQGHDGRQAWGRVKRDARLGRHKYSVVNLKTGQRNDPDGMIDPAPSP